MAKKNSYPGAFRLTLTKARQLAIQEFGTAKGLEAEIGILPGYFRMRMGNLVVRVNPDIRGSGCILVSDSGHSFPLEMDSFYSLFMRPDTTN